MQEVTQRLRRPDSSAFGFCSCWVLPMGGSSGDQRVGGGRSEYLSSKHLYPGSLWIRRISPYEAQLQFLRTTPSLCPFQLKMVTGSHGCQQDGTALSSTGPPAPALPFALIPVFVTPQLSTLSELPPSIQDTD